MNYIFNDSVLNKSFLNDGFVVIYNAIDKKTIEILKEIFFKNLPQNNKSFYTSQWINDPVYKRKVAALIGDILNYKLCSILNNYKSVYSYFMVKNPTDTSFSHAHQDWAVVDESIYTGINTWIPLSNVSKENGAMRILPQSHIRYNKPRGSYIEIKDYDCYKIFETSNFLTLKLNAGDMLLFDSRTIHATFNNQSDYSRVAVGNILIPTEAPVCHYYFNGSSIDKIMLNNDFLFDYSFGEDFFLFIKNNYETDI